MITGLWSVTLSMSFGLVMNIRPFIIISRTAICFVVSLILGYLTGFILEGYMQTHKTKSERKLNPKTKIEATEDS